MCKEEKSCNYILQRVVVLFFFFLQVVALTVFCDSNKHSTNELLIKWIKFVFFSASRRSLQKTSKLRDHKGDRIIWIFHCHVHSYSRVSVTLLFNIFYRLFLIPCLVLSEFFQMITSINIKHFSHYLFQTHVQALF